MDPDLLREWRRWSEADQQGSDEAADAAFREVFRTVLPLRPQADFDARVMQAIAGSTAQRARTSRMSAAAAVAFWLLVGAALVIEGPALLLVALDGVTTAALWLVVAMDRGFSVWAFLAQIGRAFSAISTTPQVSVALIILGLIAFAALHGLHRVVDLEERSSS
jgi:hypothetical protein